MPVPRNRMHGMLPACNARPAQESTPCCVLHSPGPAAPPGCARVHQPAGAHATNRFRPRPTRRARPPPGEGTPVRRASHAPPTSKLAPPLHTTHPLFPALPLEVTLVVYLAGHLMCMVRGGGCDSRPLAARPWPPPTVTMANGVQCLTQAVNLPVLARTSTGEHRSRSRISAAMGHLPRPFAG